jgi:hypothetical protein
MTTSTPILYLLMPSDLHSMNPGKACAQANHAGTKFVYDYLTNPSSLINSEVFNIWIRSGNGFGTTIALTASYKQIEDFNKNYTFFKDVIIDPTYPFWADEEIVKCLDNDITVTENFKIENGKVVRLCLREEMTVFYYFGNKDEIGPLFSQFELMK